MSSRLVGASVFDPALLTKDIQALQRLKGATILTDHPVLVSNLKPIIRGSLFFVACRIVITATDKHQASVFHQSLIETLIETLLEIMTSSALSARHQRHIAPNSRGYATNAVYPAQAPGIPLLAVPALALFIDLLVTGGVSALHIYENGLLVPTSLHSL